MRKEEFQQNLLRIPFTYEERVTLQSLLSEGYTQKECAQHLKRSPSVINREIKRVRGVYSFKKASLHSRKQRSKRGRKRTVTYNKNDQLSYLLGQGISPSIIVMKKLIDFKVSIQTIYNWIKSIS